MAKTKAPDGDPGKTAGSASDTDARLEALEAENAALRQAAASVGRPGDKPIEEYPTTVYRKVRPSVRWPNGYETKTVASAEAREAQASEWKDSPDEL